MKKLPNWIIYIVATLVVLLGIGVTLNLVLSQTLLSSNYVETQLDDTDAYTGLSSAISDEFTKNMKDAEQANPQEAEIIRTIITPDVVQEKLTELLSQAEGYIKHDGPAPVLDLSDVVTKAREAGLDVPADSEIAEPITFGTAESRQQFVQDVHTVRTFSTVLIVVTSVLVLLLVVLCVLRRDFRVIGTIAIIYGSLFVVIALVFWSAATIGIDRVQSGGDLFADIARKLAGAILKDEAQRFGIIGGIALVGGIIARIIFAKMHRPTGAYKASR